MTEASENGGDKGNGTVSGAETGVAGGVSNGDVGGTLQGEDTSQTWIATTEEDQELSEVGADDENGAKAFEMTQSQSDDERVGVPELGGEKQGWKWWPWLIIVLSVTGVTGWWVWRAFGRKRGERR